MRRSLALVTGLLVAGCKGDVCRDWKEERDACVDEAVTHGVDVSELYWREIECSKYDAVYYNDPVLGPVLRATAPDFGCLRRVWRRADCHTRAGLEEAVADEAVCD